VYVAQDGVLVAGTTTVTGNGRAVTFTPTVPWAPNALVQIFLTEGVWDVAGNPLSQYQGSFRTETQGTAALTVVRAIPAYAGATVPANTVLEIEYSEALDVATVPVGAQSVDNAFGAAMAVEVTLVGDRVIRLTPVDALTPTTPYYLYTTLLAGVRDVQGTSATNTPILYFVTGPTADTTVPTVRTVTPPGDATGIGLNAPVRLRFSEAINPRTVTAASVALSDGTTTLPLLTRSFSENDTLVEVVPQGVLRANQRYTVTVTGVEDAAGNGVTSGAIAFTTGAEVDLSLPAIVRTDPPEGTIGAPLNPVVMIELSEPITGDLNLGPPDQPNVGLRDGTQSQWVPVTVSLSATGRVLTLVPNEPLAVGTSYFVYAGYFAGAPLYDYSGNRYMTGNFVLAFTTGFAVDTTAPTVTGVSPVDGLTGAPTNARVVVTFSEPVRPTTTAGVRLLRGGQPVSVATDLSNGNRTLTLRPLVPLAATTPYTVQIAGVTDLAGFPVAPLTTSFTTGAGADLVAPTVVSVTPANGATNVPLGATITVLFNERINPVTITDATVQLYRSGERVEGTLAAAVDLLSATFTPNSALEPSSTYTIVISGVTDFIGQAVSGISTTFASGTSP
jgi:methionine-rich copper-binding protein CopC